MVTQAKQRPPARSPSDVRFDFFNTLFLGLITLGVLYPLIYVLSASFSNPIAVTAGRVWLLPVEFSLEGYKAVFAYQQVLVGYINSLLYTASFIVVSVSLTLCAAYPLSRPDLKGRKFFTLLFTFTMIFSGGLIPTYLLVRGLGFLNTPLALLIPNAVGVWNVIVARTFFQSSIPGELLEAAEIEGATDGQIFFKVVMPLSTSIIAVLGLFYAVYQWNGYFEAMIYIRSQHLYPLQIILRNILIANMVDSSMIMDVEEFALREALKEQLKFSLIVVASAPVLALYPFVQRHFVKGIMIGSLKG